MALGILLAGGLAGCTGRPKPSVRRLGDISREQAAYGQWLMEAPTSPMRAVALVRGPGPFTVGPDEADVPLGGVPQHVLRVTRGGFDLEGPDLHRLVPRQVPVKLADFTIVVGGTPGHEVVTIFGEATAGREPPGFYPVDTALAFEVTLDRTPPSPVSMLALDGVEVKATRVGTVAVPVGDDGTSLEVRAVPNPATEESDLEIYFRDSTNGRGTYPAGRFVALIPLGEGRYHLDFNRSRNPFCAYSTVYPCPVPWRGNTIGAPVAAGERYHGPDDVVAREG